MFFILYIQFLYEIYSIYIYLCIVLYITAYLYYIYHYILLVNQESAGALLVNPQIDTGSTRNTRYLFLLSLSGFEEML